MQGNFFYKRLGEQIAEQRRSKRLSQKALSFSSAIDRTYISRIEAGRANPTLDILEKISESLMLKMEQLIDQV